MFVVYLDDSIMFSFTIWARRENRQLHIVENFNDSVYNLINCLLFAI